MLIQGGMISSGRRATCLVEGAYWISWISSFWNTTLPGVVATLRPSSNALAVGHADLELALAALEVVQQVLQPRDQVAAAARQVACTTSGLVWAKLDGRERVDQLAGMELELALGRRVQPVRTLDRAVQAARRQQVALLDEVEDRVLRPLLVPEAAVVLGRLDHRLGRLAQQLCVVRCHKVR